MVVRETLGNSFRESWHFVMVNLILCWYSRDHLPHRHLRIRRTSLPQEVGKGVLSSRFTEYILISEPCRSSALSNVASIWNNLSMRCVISDTAAATRNRNCVLCVGVLLQGYCVIIACDGEKVHITQTSAMEVRMVCAWCVWSVCLMCLVCVPDVFGLCVWCVWSAWLMCLVSVSDVFGLCVWCVWSVCLMCLVWVFSVVLCQQVSIVVT